MMEQGCITQCVYCTKVYPDIGRECPVCQGATEYFQPAQMMDPQSSRAQMLQGLFSMGEAWEQYYSADPTQAEAASKLQKQLLHLLQQMHIYDFDLEQALLECIHQLDQEQA